MNKVFQDEAWEDYVNWQDKNEEIFKKINCLILEIEKSFGTSKTSENQLSEFCCLSIDEKNRLFYRVDDKCINIFSCKGHKFILGK